MKNQNPISSNPYLIKKLSAYALVAASGLFAGTTLAAPPSNDNFAQAINLVGNSGIQTGTNTIDATFEVDEPRLEPTNVVPINNTVWFKWTAPDSGDFTFDTLGSTDLLGAEWEAVIGIYSGPSLLDLTPLGDTPQDLSTPEIMTIPVTAGTTYFIQLAGLDSITAANISLTWSFAQTAPEATLQVTH
jgi:hypothetical protein